MIKKIVGRLLGTDRPSPNYYHECMVQSGADKFGRFPWTVRVYGRVGSGPVEVLEGFEVSHEKAKKVAYAAAVKVVKAKEAAWR
ncbi:MAG: hypothetical protein KGZ65_04270 [Sphingomonadales bacterium]|nr:hypothetical protein [Sphingomonadaceae bacterium]MBS3930429.1 hypothetical protein [Sphingomonadales bacterium]